MRGHVTIKKKKKKKSNRHWLALQLARTNPRPTTQIVGVYMNVNIAAPHTCDVLSSTYEAELPLEYLVEFNSAMIETESDDSLTLVLLKYFSTTIRH